MAGVDTNSLGPLGLGELPRMVLEAAGEGLETLLPAIRRCLDEIGAGQVLEVIASIAVIPPTLEWSLANGIAVLHLDADSQGGCFTLREAV